MFMLQYRPAVRIVTAVTQHLLRSSIIKYGVYMLFPFASNLD